MSEDSTWSFWAVEEVVGKQSFLIAVLPATGATWAKAAVGELYPDLFPADVVPGLAARRVACPGVADPRDAQGWIHFEPGVNARCPRCQRSQQHGLPESDTRISVRLVMDPRARGSRKGQSQDRCKRCHAEIEFTFTRAADPPPRHRRSLKE